MAELAADKFISLPKELLLRIRYHTHSLSDHVNFSLTCKSTYTLYDSSFWEYALKVSGWGVKNLRENQEAILKDKSQQLYPWAGLARIVVEDKELFARTCMGDAANKSTIFEDAMTTITLLQPLSAAQASEKEESPRCVLGRLFMGYTYDHDDNLVMFIRLGKKQDKHVPLFKHPFIANRFIMSPPVSEVKVDDGSALEYYQMLDFVGEGGVGNLVPPPRIPLHNPEGVTVGDVGRTFLNHLEKNGGPDFGDYGDDMTFVGFSGRGCHVNAHWEEC